MKKQHKKIFVILFISFLINGCNSIQNELNIDTTEVLYETVEEIIPTSDIEKQLIIEYYDALYNLNNDVNVYTDYSLEAIVKKYKLPIETFMNYEVSQDSEYVDYFETVHTNRFAKDLVTYFTDRHEEKSLDDEILKLSYQSMIDWYTDKLMDIQLPFSYDKQNEYIENISKNENLAKESNVFASYINKQIKAGRNIYQHTYSISSAVSYEYPNVSIYETSIGDIGFSPFIFINVNNNDCEMGFYINVKKSNCNPVKITFNDSVINSVQFDSYDDFIYIYLYKETWDESLNGMFESIKKSFESGNVIITLTEDVAFELSKEDVEEVQNYFMMFDYLLELIE